MKKALNHTLKLILAISIFGSNFSVAAFSPAKYVDANTSLYFESNDLKQIVSNLKKFWTNLRGPSAKFEMKMAGSEIEKEIGLNLLNIRQLQKFGFNVNASYATSIKFGNDENKDQFAIYLPTNNPPRVINKIVALIKEKTKKNKGFSIKKMKNGTIHLSLSDEIFINKGENFIVLANNTSSLRNALQRKSNSLFDSNPYQSLKEKFNQKYPRPNQLAMLYINAQFFHDFLNQEIKDELGSPQMIRQAQVLLDELKENVVAYGGFSSLKAKEIELSLSVIFKDGYLQDKSNLFTKLLLSKLRNNAVDMLNKRPIIYFALKFNLKGYMNLLKKIFPSTKDILQSISKDLKQVAGVNLEKHIINGFIGNLSLLIGDLPNANSLLDPTAYKLYMAASYHPKNVKYFKKMFIALRNNFSGPQGFVSMTTKNIRDGELWTIKTKRPLGKMMKDPFIIYVYLGKKGIVITTSKKCIYDVINNRNRKTIISQKLKMSKSIEKNTVMLLHFDIKKIVNYLQKSPFAALIGSYLQAVSNIKNVNLHSYIEENSTFFNLNVKLK